MKRFSTDSRNKLVFRSAIIGIALAGCVGGPMIAEVVAADAPDATVLLERSGAYCRDDPNCFNRLHPEIPTVARARPEQVIVFETRDAADSSILPPEQTPPRSPGVIGHVIHPLTGPVHIEGAKRGDVLAVTLIKIEPYGNGRTTITPGGLLGDLFRGRPFSIIWELTPEAATSSALPGVRIPHAAFPGVITGLPGPEEVLIYRDREQATLEAGGAVTPPLTADAVPDTLCGPEGRVASECLRTIPPREFGGNMDTRYMQAGVTVYLPCQVDGCGLAVGDVHFAQGDGEVAGTAIEMAARVTLTTQVLPGAASDFSVPHFEGPSTLLDLPSGSFYATTGFPIKDPGTVPPHLRYLQSEKAAELENLSQDLTLAARNALIEMIDYIQRTRGLTREQAYIVASVAVDLRIGQVVNGTNVGVNAILPLDIFVDPDNL